MQAWSSGILFKTLHCHNSDDSTYIIFKIILVIVDTTAAPVLYIVGQ